MRWPIGAALAGAVLFAAAPRPARAQAGRQVVDRVVAVVGQQPILLSQLQEEILQRLASKQIQQLPTDSAALAAVRRQVLESMIDEEVIYQKARQDTSITVTDADVQVKVEENVRQTRAQYPTDPEFRRALATAGFTSPEDWRRWLMDQQRRNDYIGAYIQKLQQDGKFKPALVTEAEMRRAFRDIQAAPGPKPKRPATVSWRQIVVAPRPKPAARAAALARAESLLVQVRGGADFQALARQWSDDPTSKTLGGDLGWFRRGTMVQSFERAAFALKPGEISNVVESPFGFHIIKMDRMQPGEVKAYHILIAPAIDTGDVAAARLRADTVAAELRAGVPFDSVARRYADTTEQTEARGIEKAKLPQAYAAAFDTARVGQVLDPFLTDPDNPTHAKYVVAILTASQPEGDYTFEDLREQLRANLSQQRAYQDLVRSLRGQTYVDDRL